MLASGIPAPSTLQGTLSVLTAALLRLTAAIEAATGRTAAPLAISAAPAASCPTFQDYTERWFRLYKKPKVREATQTMYGTVMNYHLFPRIGSRPLNEITSDELQEILLRYEDASSSSIAQIMLVLRQVFAKAVADGILRSNPVEQLSPPKGTQHERLPLTMEQVAEITQAAPRHKYGLFPLLLLYTGLRRGEAVALRWRDIDFERGIITVSHAAIYSANTTTRITDTKTKAGHRQIPLLPVLREQLKPGPPENFVLYNSKEPLHITPLKRQWAKLQADIPAMATATPHRLRHTYLLLLRRAGVDAVTQQHLMGHAGYSTTANIYTHIDDGDIRDATAQLTSALSQTLPNPVKSPKSRKQPKKP